MPPVAVSYRFEDRTAAHRVLDRLALRFSHQRQTRNKRSTTYYDTFDWRVFAEGGMLFSQSDGRSRVLHWVRSEGVRGHRATIADRPGFVWDLPPGPLRETLAPIVEMRRLLPVVTIEAEGETLRVLDARQKTVARVRLEASTAHPARGDHPSSELPPIVQVVPVRGYARQFEALVQALEEEPVERTEDSELVRAASAVGLEPGGYSRKLVVQLDPEMRSDEAVKTILHQLLEVIRQNAAGVRQNLDSEFLHDFRVAVRRTRSALTQLKGVFPPESVDHFKTEFAWLGQITGPTRDLDVYRLKMPAYRASLPNHVRSDLDPLSEFLDRHQKIEHQDLVHLLDSERYRTLLGDWQRFLDQPLPEETSLPEALTPILDLASRRIWRSARRVLKKGSAIEPDSPAEALHRLRIDCKKLRYLLEFFRSLYEPEEVGALIKALKSLQDNLGDFNDLEVQQTTLKEFAQTMMAEKLGTAKALMAMGRLVERLEHRQTEERQVFHRRFAKFSSRKNRQRLETLFKPPKKAEA